MESRQLVKLKVVLLIFLVLVPWFNANYFDEVRPFEVIQEDLSFYEINPCKISIFEFFAFNVKHIYQDHYFYRFDNSSPISCFGRISGVTLLDNSFYITIGTNSIINLGYQALIWMILMSFLKKRKINLNTSKYQIFVANILISYLFVFSIYAEKRFYSKNLYLFDLQDTISYFYLFIVIYIITVNLSSFFITRFGSLVNCLPFLYIFIFVFGGYNFHIFSIAVCFFGLISIISGDINRKTNFILLLFSVFWILNSSGRFYLNPDKLRGLTSSVYEFNANLFWTIFFILLVNGSLFLFKNSKEYFKSSIFRKNLSLTSLSLLILGLVGANFPAVNFFNYYFFGQHKFGINENNPFLINQWSEKVSWRGFYASAESVGEFYGIVIFFILISYFKGGKLNSIDYLGLIASTIGLYFSNNRTAMLFVMFLLVTNFIIRYKTSKILVILSLAIASSVVAYIIGLQNLLFSVDYTSSVVLSQAVNYRFANISSSFLLATESSNSIFLKLFSYISFLLNRSEIWGIFISRYNPSYFELLLGSGPFNFGQLYGEILIKETRSFLLPHSSILSFLVFFGALGLSFLIIFLLINFYKSRKKMDSYEILLFVYICFNIVKNDVLNYLPSLLLYSFLIFFLLNKDFRKSIFL